MKMGLILIAVIGCISCGERAVTYAEARAVVNRRCLACHAEKPANQAFPVAPQGVKLDTASEMKQYAERIEVTASVDYSMPLVNMTAMTEDERKILHRWVDEGAKIP